MSYRLASVARALLLGAALLGGCESPAPATPMGLQPGTPTGTGCDDAIPIQATTTREGVAAEYVWIRRHFPGYRPFGQRLKRCGERVVDIIYIASTVGRSREVYFDISSFYGK